MNIAPVISALLTLASVQPVLSPVMEADGLTPENGHCTIQYAPGFDPSPYNWYVRVSPDLVHWTMWGSHTLEDTDDLVYRRPAGRNLFLQVVGYPQPQP